MVQVDVFWSYGIGAGMAVASARQIQAAARAKAGLFDGPAFRDNMLFLSLLFAPSGIFLLTAFPHWETMHVARTLSDIPPWLATLFAFTNITQGILGFAVASWLIRRGQLYAAALQWVLGYFCVFFILVHGWDGTGYMRFFSARPELVDGWTWATAGAWLVSDVGISLDTIGVAFIPALLWCMSRPIKAGYALDPQVDEVRASRVSAWALAASLLIFQALAICLAAIAASLLVRALGWVVGFAVFGVLAWGIALRRGGLFHRYFRTLLYATPYFSAAPAQVEAGAHP